MGAEGIPVPGARQRDLANQLSACFRPALRRRLPGSRRTACLAALALLGLTAPPCTAQQAAGVTLRFLSFPKEIDPQPVELWLGEGKTSKVEIPGNELSAPHKVPPLATWVVGETTKGPDGKPVFKEYGRAKALAAPSQLILLVRKGAQNSDGFAVIPVDSGATRFGGGKFLFANAARVDIAGVVGGERFALKPGQHTIIKPKLEPGAGTVHATLYYRKEEEAKPFFSSQWPVSANARGLIFLYHDPDTGRLRLHTIRDYP